MPLGASVPQSVMSHQVVPRLPTAGPLLQIQSVVVGAHQVAQRAASAVLRQLPFPAWGVADAALPRSRMS
jgi:hypothetical protein